MYLLHTDTLEQYLWVRIIHIVYCYFFIIDFQYKYIEFINNIVCDSMEYKNTLLPLL